MSSGAPQTFGDFGDGVAFLPIAALRGFVVSVPLLPTLLCYSALVVSMIHDAVRRHCMEQAVAWRRQYVELSTRSGASIQTRGDGWSYSDEAYDLFPRYQVLQAILDEVESFVPADFVAPAEALALLSLAGETAQSQFTRIEHRVAIAAMMDERRQFAAFVDALDLTHAAQISPLPFRRKLGEKEHQAWHRALRDTWGSWDIAHTDRDEAPPHVTLHVAVMEAPGALEHLRHVIAEHGDGLLFELHDLGHGYEIDPLLATFDYGGLGEGFWIPRDVGWMIYASHEASLTFGGPWLIERMRAFLPAFERYQYKGADIIY